MITDSEIHDLSEVVSERLRSKGLRCGFAESLTGGMISSSIVDIPGASDVLEGAIVSYTNAMKMNVLGVPEHIIEKYTEVSLQCAEYMAVGAGKVTGADICIAVTGYAGGNDSDEHDGYVCIGYCYKDKIGSFERKYDGDRREVRMQTVACALRSILELTKDNE